MKIHALWCHPRSMSTAFERIMRERGDLDVLHEPFMYEYYLNQSNRMFAEFEPDPAHPSSYDGIRDMILARSREGPVFFKDMAYYVQTLLPEDPGFMAAMSHCFLIRRPEESILSYHGRDPGFTLAEVGIEAQWRLYQVLVAAGHDPIVLKADDIRANPEKVIGLYWAHVGLPHKPEAFDWEPTVPKGWESVKDWHGDAITSGGIRPPETGRDHAAELEELGAPWTGYLAHHRPFYEALCKVATRP